MKDILLLVSTQTDFAIESRVETRIKYLLESNIFDVVIGQCFSNRANAIPADVTFQTPFYKDRGMHDYGCVDDNFMHKLLELNGGAKPAYVYIAGIDNVGAVFSNAVRLSFKYDIRPFILSNYCIHNGGMDRGDLERILGSASILSRFITDKNDLMEVY